MRGTIGIVAYGGESAYVGDALLHTLQEQVVEISDSMNGYVERFDAVVEVAINEGRYAGYDAMFDCRVSGHDRVRVLLELLKGHQIRLELSSRQLQSLTQ